jgi:hypothetical protein
VSHNPEKELEEFLASIPAWMQRCLLTGFGSLNQDEIREWSINLDEDLRLTKEYERILQQIPAKWREYRKRLKVEAQPLIEILVPKGKAGRPRKTALAQEAVELQQRGMNFPQIAAELNKRHGEDTTTLAAVPKLIKRFFARTKSSA